MSNRRPVYTDKFGREFSLPKWTKRNPALVECAHENSNFREALELAPQNKYSPGAALIRSLLSRYAVTWKMKTQEDVIPYL